VATKVGPKVPLLLFSSCPEVLSLPWLCICLANIKVLCFVLFVSRLLIWLIYATLYCLLLSTHHNISRRPQAAAWRMPFGWAWTATRGVWVFWLAAFVFELKVFTMGTLWFIAGYNHSQKVANWRDLLTSPSPALAYIHLMKFFSQVNVSAVKRRQQLLLLSAFINEGGTLN